VPYRHINKKYKVKERRGVRCGCAQTKRPRLSSITLSRRATICSSSPGVIRPRLNELLITDYNDYMDVSARGKQKIKKKRFCSSRDMFAPRIRFSVGVNSADDRTDGEQQKVQHEANEAVANADMIAKLCSEDAKKREDYPKPAQGRHPVGVG